MSIHFHSIFLVYYHASLMHSLFLNGSPPKKAGKGKRWQIFAHGQSGKWDSVPERAKCKNTGRIVNKTILTRPKDSQSEPNTSKIKPHPHAN